MAEPQKKVDDPSGISPNRKVTDKKANRPFLAYKAYREAREAEHDAWLERKKERDEKIARGEEVGPLEPDPTAATEVDLSGVLKFLVYALVFSLLAGKFFTGSYMWGYDVEGKYIQLKKQFMPQNGRLFSERLLAEFDGRVPDRPIYLAIDGDVYDVSKGKAYQPGGSYSILAGVDGARAFATGCFKEHRTHDLRGLTQSELDSVKHWKDFYENHKEYTKVGRVSHKPIDPASEPPEHCQAEKKAKKAEKKAREAAAKASSEASGQTRQEL